MRVTSTPANSIARRPAIAAKAAAPTPAPAPAKAQAPMRTGIEVDVNGQVDATGGLHATGVVKMDRAFMERLLKHLTRKQKTFGERNLKYDPVTKTYGGDLVVKIKGHALHLTGRAVPVIDDNMPGFKFEQLSVKVGPFNLHAPFLTKIAAKLIAQEITDDVIKASPGPNGVIRIETSSLLHEIEVLPTTWHVSDATKFAVKVTESGGIDVALTSDVAAPTGANTDKSDLSIAVDEAAVKKMLTPLLYPDYQLSSVAITPGAISVNGKVEAKPLSDIINVGKGLLAIFLGANGVPVRDVSPEKAMIDLRLDAKLNGTQVVLTPSIGAALKDLQASLVKAGLKPTVEGKSLRFDVAELVARYGVDGIQATQGKLQGKAKMNINDLITAPILRGEA